MDKAIQGLQANYAGAIDRVSVQYPAAPFDLRTFTSGLDEFLDSVQQGVDELKLLLQSRASRCPVQKVVPIGYSQGAWVVHRALVELSGTGTYDLARVAAVVLIADPLRIARSSTNTGTAKHNLYGSAVALRVAERRDVPASVRAVTESLCYDGDGICAYKKRDVVGTPAFHALYKTVGAWEAGARAGRRLPAPLGPAPTMQSVIGRPDGHYELTWKDNSIDETGWQFTDGISIESTSVGPGDCPTCLYDPTRTLEGNRQGTFASYPSGDFRCWRVRAVTPGGTTSWSNEICAVIP